MKVIGCILVFGAGWTLQLQLLHQYSERIRMGEELTQALDLLRYGIFVLHEPLLSLLESCAAAGTVSTPFFEALLAGIREERDFAELWRAAAALLPACYQPLWLPLGQALPLGEQEELLILTREETHCLVSELRREKQNTGKLICTLCLSASLLVIVVLI